MKYPYLWTKISLIPSLKSHKNYLKVVQGLTCNIKEYKTSRRNMGVNHRDLAVGKDFLDRSQKKKKMRKENN